MASVKRFFIVGIIAIFEIDVDRHPSTDILYNGNLKAIYILQSQYNRQNLGSSLGDLKLRRALRPKAARYCSHQFHSSAGLNQREAKYHVVFITVFFCCK